MWATIEYAFLVASDLYDKRERVKHFLLIDFALQ